MEDEIKIRVLARLSFSMGLKSGLSWFRVAYELRESALTLRRSCLRSKKEPSDQSHMLLGFAFENLFKAYYIATNSIGVQLPKSINSHELLKLRQSVISWNADEEEKVLLVKLTTAIYWQGRYPIALKEKHNRRAKLSRADLAKLDRLWRKYTDEIPDKIKDEYSRIMRAMENKKKRTALLERSEKAPG